MEFLFRKLIIQTGNFRLDDLFLQIKYPNLKSSMQGEQKSHDCCPKGSWPALQADYKPKGDKINIGDTTCYHIGQGKKALIMVSDIFGATSGHHEAVADTYASLGYNVYLPELLSDPYTGEMDIGKIMANIKGQNVKLMQERFAAVVKHLQQNGMKRFFSVGFCWGVWFQFKLSATNQGFIAIAGMHPSLGIQKIYQRVPLKLAQQIKCPAFLYPAGNDPVDIKQGGQIIEALKEKFGAEKTGTYQFPDMVHGWTVRGDRKDQKVHRDVEKALQMSHAYFSKFQT